MKVGDYVYIKGISRDYGIGKITQLNSGYSSNGGELIDIQFKHSKHSVPKINVISSPNIIDLIEVGDYVNGSKVVRIEKHDEELYAYVQETEYCNACDEEENIYYKENTIKSIVTKEQFSQMEYRIGDE